MKYIYSFLFILFAFHTGYSQFSKIHYIPPITSATNSGMAPGEQYLYISTPNTSLVTVTITPIGGVPFTATVTNSLPIQYAINTTTSGNTGRNSQLFTPNTAIGKLTNKGYLIEASDLIYANIRVTSNNGSQAGGLVAKGTSAMGKTFRIAGMLNKWNPLNNNFDSLLNFASFMATENDTHVTISLSDPLAIGTPMTNGIIYNGPISVTLNKNESYIFSFENTATIFRSSYMQGGLIQSDKNIVVNSGSFGGNSYTPGVTGDNGTVANNNLTDGSTTGDFKGKDYGFDQIVPYEKTGKEYVFVKGLGSNALERVMVVAHVDGTQIFKNGSTTASATINAGGYYVFDGSDFINGNLYVTTSEKVFCYQAIGGNTDLGNQNLFFVPPINCSTPSVVDNIPLIEKIGSQTFSGNVNIVTVSGSTVSVNNVGITSTPVNVTGTSNPTFVRYTLTGRTGNIKISSTNQVYVSYFGRDNNATYGSYYSGFDSKPEINFTHNSTATSNCIPNITLNLNPIALTDSYSWFLNGSSTPIPGQTTNVLTPTQPGYYQATRQNAVGCAAIYSDIIPVSDCPSNIDNDAVSDNLDIDDDNDGITNCTESYGNQVINMTNSNLGNVTVGNYSNPYTGTVSTSTTASPSPFIGSADGSFITSIPAGNSNWITYKMNFVKPVSLGLEYVSTANATDLINPKSEYIVTSDINKNITVLNPNNQLLIDTNYDGVFESGVTEFSSFEIRFRLNSPVSLNAGTGTFKFLCNLTNSFSITHKNLSEIEVNNSTFKLIATCVPKDTDSDGISDYLDIDSDNDGILDTIEAQGTSFIAYTISDVNNDGLSDAFGTGILPVNSDSDSNISTGINYDYIDLDSDNDGIYDLVESGSNGIDSDSNGIVDGVLSSFGSNGLSNSLETTPDSGILNYIIADADSDGIKNYLEIDSDNDGCNDVNEAGFSDNNNDGLLGSTPLNVNVNGVVTSGSNGYTFPNNSYVTFATIVITTQPYYSFDCASQSATINVFANSGNTYQWQFSTDGINWISISNNATYSGATTNTLLISGATPLMNGDKYRVILSNPGNSCGLISSPTTLSFPIAPSATFSYAGIPFCPNSATPQVVTMTGSGAYTGGVFSSTAGLTIDAASGAITPSTSVPGNYIVTYLVPASGGCAAFPITTSVVVSEIPTASISYNGTPFCDSITTSQLVSLSGTANFTGGIFSSSPGLTIDSINGSITPSSSSSGNYIVTYTLSSSNGCYHVITDTNVVINATPVAIANPSLASICSAETTNINLSSTIVGTTYSWTTVSNNVIGASSTTGTTISDLLTNTSTLTGNVIYTVTPKANGCSGSPLNITVNVNSIPVVNLNDGVVCVNQSTNVAFQNCLLNSQLNNATYTFKWYLNGGLINGAVNSTYLANHAGNYSVIATNNTTGCSSIMTNATVTSSFPGLTIDTNQSAVFGDTTTIEVLVSGGNATLLYSLDNGPYQSSSIFTIEDSLSHFVSVTDINGCTYLSKEVRIISYPTYFTPNGDGFHDTWNILGLGASTKIFIFDRYGKLIKQINSPTDGWDGNLNGQPLNAEDYWFTVYYYEGAPGTGTNKVFKSHFALKR